MLGQGAAGKRKPPTLTGEEAAGGRGEERWALGRAVRGPHPVRLQEEPTLHRHAVRGRAPALGRGTMPAVSLPSLRAAGRALQMGQQKADHEIREGDQSEALCSLVIEATVLSMPEA